MATKKSDVVLMAAWRSGKNKFTFGHVDTAGSITEYLRGLTDTHDAARGKQKQRVYSVEDTIEDGEYFVAEFKKGSKEAELCTAILNIDAMDQIGAAQLRAKKLAFYALVVGNDAHTRRAYIRKKSPVVTVRPGWTVFELADTLSRIDNPVLVLEDRFDLVVDPNHIEIVNGSVFETLFYEMTGINEQVDDWVDNVAAKLPMDASTKELLIKGCRSNKRLLRRLRAVQDRGHLSTVTMERFKAYVSSHPDLDISQFVKNGKISADGANHGTLLQILNEDLFKGGLTDDPFTAQRKTQRKITSE